MKVIVLFVLVSITRIAGYAQDDIIFWSKQQPLKWEDYKGQVDETSKFYAATLASIKYRYGYNKTGTVHNFKFQVNSYFTKSRSWSKKEHQSAPLLKHEQLHFDLTELYARKLKEELERTSYTDDFKERITQIFNSKKTELSNIQQRYDDETDHSRNKEKQMEWQAYIDGELRKTKPTNSE
jgi:hypothetical protein